MNDQFESSPENLEVLKVIPEMMTIRKWRKQIRHLVLDFKLNNGR